MRKFLALAFCLALSPACALSLNDHSKQEARLFKNWLSYKDELKLKGALT